MKPYLLVMAVVLVPAGAAMAQGPFDPNAPPAPSNSEQQCPAGQVLQSNGEPCLAPAPKPSAVQSTGVLGSFPLDLPQAPPSGVLPSNPTACQPGQAVQANGQACSGQ